MRNLLCFIILAALLTALLACPAAAEPAADGAAAVPISDAATDPAVSAAAADSDPDALPAGPAEAPDLALSAPSAILIDAATGAVLYERNADERREPASVTKVMTLLLVMEALDSGKISMDDPVVASAAAAGKGGSQIYLEEGERLSMDELLKSVVVSSANDCATALAEHVAGSESAFVELMNRRARELGMENTRFVNCTGLDDDPAARKHLTTARDVAVMSRALLRHDAIRRYTTIWTDTVRGGQFGLSNTNKLVRFYQGTTGLKTGYTSAAGHCLAASAEREGLELIAVVLGCDSSSGRFADAKTLLNWGFATFALVRPDPADGLTPIPVELGAAQSVTPVLADDTPVLISKADRAGVTQEVELEPGLAAPVEKGRVVGVLRIRSNGKTLAERPLTCAEDVPRLTFAQILLRVLRALCG